MDKTVPPGAALLLDFIGDIEAPKGYDTVYGNNQHKLAKSVTSMTLAEIQAAQAGWTKSFGSSATGRYQFMKATLAGLIVELGLSPAQKLDANLQDRLAYHLLKRRGYEAFMSGTIGRQEFGKQLAQEWASLPVLAATKGGSRQVSRGQSYYAGDGLNKSLVTPDRVENLLAKMKAAGSSGAQSDLGIPISERDQSVEVATKAPPAAAPAPPAESAEPGFWSSLLVMLLSAFKGKR